MQLRSSYRGQLEELTSTFEELVRAIADIFECAREAVQTGTGIDADRIERLSFEIAAAECEFETTAFRFLFLQRPVAKDLREVSGALKAVIDLKRIGELSLDVLRLVSDMEGEIFEVQRADLAELSCVTSDMVEQSCTAYKERDLDRAMRAARLEDACDEYMEKVRDCIFQAVCDGEMDPYGGVNLLMVAKSFERIAGHAGNIARWTGCLVKGEVPV